MISPVYWFPQDPFVVYRGVLSFNAFGGQSRTGHTVDAVTRLSGLERTSASRRAGWYLCMATFGLGAAGLIVAFDAPEMSFMGWRWGQIGALRPTITALVLMLGIVLLLVFLRRRRGGTVSAPASRWWPRTQQPLGAVWRRT
jgi:hypothetical protein